MKKINLIKQLFVLLVLCISPFCIGIIIDFALTGDSKIISDVLIMPLSLVGAIISYIVFKKENTIIYKFSMPSLNMIIPVFFIGFTFKQSILCLLRVFFTMNVHNNDENTVYNLIVSVLIAAISEEMIFRGALTDILIFNGVKSSSIIIVLTSILWALSHLYGLSLPTILLFVDGIILGYIYTKTKNIILCMIYHAANNASILILGGINVELWNCVLTINIVILLISIIFLSSVLIKNSKEFE